MGIIVTDGLSLNQIPSRINGVMELKLKSLRKKVGWTQDVLAEKSGISRPYIAAIESSKMRKSPSIETLTAFARALNVRVGDLFDDARPVSIVGKVGAGARVPLFDATLEGGGLYQVACPSELSNEGNVVGVEIEGDSVLPIYHEGDILFYSRDAYGVPTEAVGRICICEDEKGEAWVKYLRSGSEPSRFHLISLNPLAENMFDVILKWASPVKLHRPHRFAEKM